MAELLNRLAFRQAVRQINNGTLGVSVEQYIGFTVNEHRATNLVAPVVIVSHAPETGLDAANDNGNILVGFARPLAINSYGTVRPLAGNVARV